ncbi:MAG: hypothetical protein ACLVO2_12735 [Clostridia bacterium]
MDDIKKTPLNTTKLGEVRLPISLFDAPEVGQIKSARFSPRRDSNGNVIEGSLGKITLEVINFKLLQVMIKNGGSEADLSPVTLEYVTDEAILKGYKAEDLIGRILDLRQSEVALKWVSRGASGSWGGFKLVCSTLKFVQLPTNKATV